MSFEISHEETIKGHIDWYFPTPIYNGTILNSQHINEIVAPFIYKYFEDHPIAVEKADEYMRTAVSTYYHDNTLFKAPELKELCTELVEHMNDYGDMLNVNMEGHKWAITSMFLNMHKPGALHGYHNHSQCYFSGVYWVQVPEEAAASGVLIAHDPRSEVRRFEPPYNSLGPGTTLSTSYVPVAGECRILPSWLNHEVVKNKSNEDRLAIAFDFQLWKEDGSDVVTSTEGFTL